MTKPQIERFALIAAALVIVALTGAAFWLSYAHLAEVAGAHGLGHAPERQWAWPATLDAFIVAGELLMLRAGLQGRKDWWAIGLTASGSLGSIGLNVAGVGAHATALDYVVAAVPPAAALLAFGALMRQVHGLVAEAEPTPAPVVDIERDTTPSPVETEVSSAPALAPAPAPAKFLVICGDTLPIPAVPPRPKLGTEAARAAIEQAWRDGLSVREAARVSTRSPSQVQRVYARLDAERGPQLSPGQTEIAVQAA